MKQNPNVNEKVMDIEDLARHGKNRTLCPYFLSREMAANADIVFMPYNYLVDPMTRNGLGINWDNAVLIFDEAHNVEVSERCIVLQNKEVDAHLHTRNQRVLH
jgi:regulator of telomere elongation helicase 1